MSDSKWYQKSSWTPEDREDFFARLKRARSDYNKAQYLRIQAYYLQSATPPDYHAALDLLDTLINEYPDPNELGMTWLQRAKCLEALERNDEALDAYLRAIKDDLNHSGIHTTDSPLHFAMFVLRHDLKERYNDVLESLKGSETVMLMPWQRYMACAAMSIIADDNGMKDKARDYARKALDFAGESTKAQQYADHAIHKKVLGLAARNEKGKWWQFWK